MNRSDDLAGREDEPDVALSLLEKVFMASANRYTGDGFTDDTSLAVRRTWLAAARLVSVVREVTE